MKTKKIFIYTKYLQNLHRSNIAMTQTSHSAQVRIFYEIPARDNKLKSNKILMKNVLKKDKYKLE